MSCIQCYALITNIKEEVRCETCLSPMHNECSIKVHGTNIHHCDACFSMKPMETSKPTFKGELPNTIRRTYIETYRTCPYKFYLEVVKGIEQPPTIYTQLGIDLHELFEQASKDNTFTHQQMVDEFEKIWHNYNPSLFDDEKQKENMYQRGIDSIDTFYSILPTLAPLFISEEKIEFSIGEGIPSVNITMDRINEVDGELEMVDWKTGRVMVGKKLSSDLQAPLYIYAVKQKYGKPVKRFTFYYLQENKVRTFERIDEDKYVCMVGKKEYVVSLTETIREIKSIFSRIMNKEFNIPRDTRKMYFACKMCHLKQGGQCQGADVESWKIANYGG